MSYAILKSDDARMPAPNLASLLEAFEIHQPSELGDPPCTADDVDVLAGILTAAKRGPSSLGAR